MNTVDLVFAGFVGGVASVLALYPVAAWAETRFRHWLARAPVEPMPEPEPAQWPKLELPVRGKDGRFISKREAMRSLLERDVAAAGK
jgi:hypothetical protein